MDVWIIRLIEQGGYWGIAALMFIENVFPPIPSELIMGLGGVFVARGTMEFWPLMFAGTVGSTLGNYVWFLAGDKLGYRRLQPLVRRHGRWLTISWSDVEKATAFFQRHGQWIVFFLRFSPFLRTLISLPAGLTHMKHWKFLVFTFAGAAVWNALLIVGGHWLADYMAAMDHLIGPTIMAMILLAVAAWLYRVIRWQPDA
ncbi:membrane protein DedA with SNARE-associated domain [Novosphingobium kunmingense]|uniref:Membrane protein DedA with SNARE-associated domain n=1 Tax=Novosphingobium kunmingense TaxID=1211806 RepID=A0A2N0I2M5_9SPHN|nr:DedA family protein [Novosphingobium kunmingense]PKB25444.1 membrane protein DedA with SNARE-associated domain [Novosphingobium kunmingense]